MGLNFATIFQLVVEGAVAVENVLGRTQPHETKKQIVVQSVDAVAKTLEQAPDPQVAGIAAVVDLGTETIATLFDAIHQTLTETGVIKAPPKPAGQSIAAGTAKSPTTQPIPLKG